MKDDRLRGTPVAEANTGVIFGVGVLMNAFPLCAGGCGFGAGAVTAGREAPSLYAVWALPYGTTWLVVEFPIRLFPSTELVGSGLGLSHLHHEA